MFIQDFKNVAKKFPNRTAAVCRDMHITYDELDRKSSKIASFLLNKFEGKCEIIGYYGERSIETLIAVLGIWKAGAAYLPFDTCQPFERRRIICEKSKVQFLLVDCYSDMCACVECMSVSEILLENQQNPIVERNVSNERCDDIAYIIFTSGTTGTPKGAMVTHSGMYNHLQAKKEFLKFTEKTKLAQTANIGFDISIWQLFLPLMLGATVYFVSEKEIMNLKKFTGYIIDNSIQILEIVPSYLELWLNYLQNRKINLPSLHFLFVTGEVFNPDLANKSLIYLKHVNIVNAYGPAEAADDVTHYILDANIHYDKVPLGTSIPGMRVDILDELKQPLPIGMKGTIFVTGIGVGKGYINDLAKTADSFFDNLIVPGNCSYDTGDTGYIGEDGLLYYCGRMNNQVKVCGHRIELEEIEMRLQLLDGIRDAIVEAKEDFDKKGKKLVAYVVLDNIDQVLTKTYIIGELEKNLPYYMIPKEYYICSEFPLSVNGKVDRTQVFRYTLRLIK